MNISAQIRTARLAAGLSQGALAELIDTTQQQIAKYESGKQSPTAEKLELIAKALNTTFIIS